MTTKHLPKSTKTFLDAYIECALWSSVESYNEGDEGYDRPLDDNYGPEDIHPDTLQEMQDECLCFIDDNLDDILTFCDDSERCFEMAGHDFWLTRVGHGAGFWDGDWDDAVGKRLTAAAKVWGNVDLYVGDDGKIHQA